MENSNFTIRNDVSLSHTYNTYTYFNKACSLTILHIRDQQTRRNL